MDAVAPPTLGPDGKVRDGEGLLARLARLEKLRNQGSGAWRAVSPGLPRPTVPNPAAGSAVPLVALGASTGGPDALARILADLPSTLPAAVIVVQHIAADFAAP